MEITKKGQYRIHYTKGRQPNSLKAREIFKIISKSIDMPYERVQDVFQAWYEIVDYCLEQNIDIPILNIGILTSAEFKAKKKGDIIHVKKGFRYRDENNNVQRATENFDMTAIEDKPDYYIPKFKFYKSFKEKLKESTYHYGENKQD